MIFSELAWTSIPEFDSQKEGSGCFFNQEEVFE